MNLKAFVSNRVRAVWLRADLGFVQEQSYPFQRRVGVHLTRRFAQLDEACTEGADGRDEALKRIASDEEYALSALQQTGSSDEYASRIVLNWIGAYSALRQDPEFYELVETSLWSFINGVLTPGQVAELIGIPDPDPLNRREFPKAEPASSVEVSQHENDKKEGDNHVEENDR